MNRILSRLCLILLAGASGVALAAEEEAPEGAGTFIPLTADKPFIHVIHEGRSVRVQRAQDPAHELTGYYARTSRKCPPFCPQPMEAGPGVRTVGETDLFAFMEGDLRDGDGVLIDARTPSWYHRGTIPGSVNVPFNVLAKESVDAEMIQQMARFGVKPRGEIGLLEGILEDWGLGESEYLSEQWDFTGAKRLMLWCNGPFCGQSPRAIQGLLKAGYPAEKLMYYRGGMQVWQLFGLPTIVPEG